MSCRKGPKTSNIKLTFVSFLLFICFFGCWFRILTIYSITRLPTIQQNDKERTVCKILIVDVKRDGGKLLRTEERTKGIMTMIILLLYEYMHRIYIYFF